MKPLAMTTIMALVFGLGSFSTAHAATPQCTITGTAASETIQGTSGDDVICGLGGNDKIYAGEGDDEIISGPGTDTVFGEDGEDVIYGGPGGDLWWGGDGSDALIGEAGNDQLEGGAGPDRNNGGDGTDYCSPDPQDISRLSCFRDNSAPKFVAVAFQRAKVNSDQDAVALLRATVRDFGTGAKTLSATINSMSGTNQISASGSHECIKDQAPEPGLGCLRSGTRLKGIWEFAFPIAAHTPSSRYELAELSSVDYASNDDFVEALGAFNVKFRVETSTPDSLAPVLSDMEFSATGKNVDVSIGENPVVTAYVSDNLSGVQKFSINLTSSHCVTLKQRMSAMCQKALGPDYLNSISFIETSPGTFVGEIFLASSAFNGNWQISEIWMTDKIGNRRELRGKAVSKFANILNFKVINGKAAVTPDAINPVIQTLTLSRSKVNTATAAQIVEVRMRITDNKKVNYVWASVTGPNSHISEPEIGCSMESGTAKNGVWRCLVRIPAHGATGEWLVEFFAWDESNNWADYSPAVQEIAYSTGYVIQNRD